VLLGALACWGTVGRGPLGAVAVRHHAAWLAPGQAEWQLMAAVLAGGLLASLVPGWRAYRLSLADGLSPRI
jgi:putative ABC transport system permease protein